jgi:hypothetical protein
MYLGHCYLVTAGTLPWSNYSGLAPGLNLTALRNLPHKAPFIVDYCSWRQIAIALIDPNTHWQTLIADDVFWELAYAPSIGHPAHLSEQEEAVRHAI